MPKYNELADTLRDDISRNFRPGEKYYAQRDLMKSHNMSFATVDRALKLLSREGLIVRSRGSGTYVCPPRAKSDDVDLTRCICIFTPKVEADAFEDKYYSQLYAGIKNRLIDSGFTTLFVTYDDRKVLPSNRSSSYYGMLFIAPLKEHKVYLKMYEESGVPSVVVGAQWADVRIPFVDSDVVSGTSLAVDYLRKLGHSRIAFINTPYSTMHADLRLISFMTRSKELGQEFREEWILNFGSNDLRDQDREKIHDVFCGNNRPTAILFSSYLPVTLPVIAELRALGLSFPEDISIIGYDNPVWLAHFTPKLTYVSQPLFEIGQHAVEKLMMQADHQNSGFRKELFPVEIVENESVVRKTTDMRPRWTQ